MERTGKRLAGLILRSQSGFYQVQTEIGVLECRLRGRLKKQRRDTDIAVIGDHVEVSQVLPGQGAVEDVLPRRTRLSRRASGPRGAWREDVLAANVDQALLVFACAAPEFHPRMLDRYLAPIELSEQEAVVIANKVDLVGEDAAHALFAPYERLGYPVIYTSPKTGLGLDALRERLAGRISVVTGESGVGKSSLLNAAVPGLHLATAEISEAVQKGRHTTRVAELIPLDLPGGGYVADTPGVREVGLWRFPVEKTDWCFREFRPYLGQCFFENCTHGPEPDCAVKAAVVVGAVTPERYESYLRLREEAVAGAAPAWA